MNFKLFILMFISIILISSVPAMEWDNIKEFKDNGEYGTIEVYNSFIIPGIFKGDKLVEYTLTEHSSSIFTGYSRIEAELFEDGILLEKMKAYDKDNKDLFKDMKKFDIVVKKQTFVNYDIDDYELQCEDVFNVINQTTDSICENIIIGNHIEIKEEWIDVDYRLGKEEISGNYTIELFGEREDMNSGSVDWVFEALGIESTEWATWWDSDWLKKKRIDINETTNTNFSNYSVFLSISFESSMQTDFDDLRFLDEAQTTEIPYWIESKTDGVSANVWVKTPLNASLNTTIYMYYGNDGVSTTGNANDTFIWYDNMSTDRTGEYSITEISTSGGSPSDNFAFSTNKYTVSGWNTNREWIIFPTSMAQNPNVEVFGSLAYTGGTDVHVGVATRAATGQGYLTYKKRDDGVMTWKKYAGGSVIGSDVDGTDNDAARINITMSVFKTNLTRTFNGTDSFTENIINALVNDGVAAMHFGGSTNGNLEYYLFRVREYSNPEPIVTIGSEIENTGISTIQSSPVDNFNTISQTIDLLCNFTSSGITNISNVTVLVYDSSNNLDYEDTDTTPGDLVNSYNKTWTTSILTDDIYNWSCSGRGDDNTFGGTTNRTFTIDSTFPVINIISPTGVIPSIVLGDNLSLNWTVSDSNLDTCLFEYNNINTTVICGDNNYSFITVSGQQSIIFYANDTFGNLGSNSTSWTYTFVENSQTFNNNTIEGSLETFLANITLGSGLSVSSTLFIYDDSSNIAESFISGTNNILRMSNFVIPNVAGQQTFNFTFQVTLSDSSVINLSTQAQTVSNISIDDCTDNSFELYNFTLIDEEDQDTLSINTTIEVAVNVLSIDREITVTSLSNNFNNTNPVLICLNNLTGDSSYVVDATVRYEAQDHVIEYYNIRNSTITNETTISNIFLFDLLTDDSTDFQLTFKGSDFVAVEGALVSIQRQYISENVFKTVELPITDANGQTIVHLVRNDVVYNIIVSKDNSVLGTFNNIIAFCEDFTIGNCQINLNAFSSTEEVFNYNDALGISFTTIIYNETTRIASINFLTSDGTTKTVNFTMSKDDIFGNNSVCSSQVVSSGGTLTCTVPTFIDTSPLTAQVFVDGEQSIIDSIYLTTRNIGTFGYFIMFLMILSITMMLLSSKTMTLIGLFVGVGSSMVLTLVEGKVIGAGSSLIWLAVVIIAMIWKLNKGKVE